MYDGMFCLKCRWGSILSEDKFCRWCGGELVTWELECECGAPISYSFTFSVVPFRGMVPLYKHCTNCGRRIDKRIIDYLETLKLRQEV